MDVPLQGVNELQEQPGVSICMEWICMLRLCRGCQGLLQAFFKGGKEVSGAVERCSEAGEGHVLGSFLDGPPGELRLSREVTAGQDKKDKT